MASPHDDEREPLEGIRIELPFFAFRFGNSSWRWQADVPDDEAYYRARRRVRARLGFYRHLATYAAVIAAALLLDLITGGGISDPVLWLAGIWGAILIWQAFNVYVFPSVWSREAEERMIQEEMRKLQDGDRS